MRELFSAGGLEQSLTNFDPYGQVLEQVSGQASHLGFTGALTDESGFDYLNARTYDPAVGEFLSSDPVQGQPYNPQSFNSYDYVQDNPVNYTDPSGKCLEFLLAGPEGIVPTGLCAIVVAFAAAAADVATTAVVTAESVAETAAPIAINSLSVIAAAQAGSAAASAGASGAGNTSATNLLAGYCTYSVYICAPGTYAFPIYQTNVFGQITSVNIVVNRNSSKGHADQLPTGGSHPYAPPKMKGVDPKNNAVTAPGGQKGFIDADGNVWEWAQEQHGGPHWDVQHPDGSHTNIFPDGKVVGPDNF